MKKNVSGQHIGAQVINASTGAGVTASVTATVSKDGGAFSASGGTLTHLANGYWDYAPTQAETNCDYFAVQFTATGAIPVTIYGYTMFPQSGDAYPTINANLDATVSSRMATFTLPANFSSLAISVSGHISNVDTLTTYTGNTPQTGDAYARIGAPAGASVSADVAAVNAKTTNLPASPAATGAAMTLTTGERTSVAGAVWDLSTTGHTTSGTFGAAMNAAGAAGDPWSTSLPGSYASGTAGNIVGNNLNASVSSRLAAASISLSAGAVTVGTNNDKTGYALTAAYDAAKTAAQAGDAMALTATERNSVADALLDRNMATGTDSGSPTVRTVRQALRQLRNKWTNSGGTLTVYKEDDATTSWTSTLATDGTAEPITGSDPA